MTAHRGTIRVCKGCGEEYEHVFTAKGGKPPLYCPAHRKPQGSLENADHEGNAARRKARQNAMAEGARKASVAADAITAADLAAGLSIFTDPTTAARYVGISQRGEDLAELVEAARRDHAGVVDGDPAELGRRLNAAIHLLLNSVVRDRDQLAPRDRGQAGRALAQIHQYLGGSEQSRFAEINLTVVGADGRPMDILADPKPPTT